MTTLIANCVYYTDATNCLICDPGFFLNADTPKTCTACGSNCAVCTSASACTKCTNDANADATAACATAVAGTNCATSANDGTNDLCTSCAANFYMSAIGVCSATTTVDAATYCHWTCGDISKPPGTYTNAPCVTDGAATNCKTCIAGSYL